ncbi:MAG: hypothetical protein A2Y03_02340 [Omnitrophica WOR_2 bacterium GWF2_38_59]|nr:MAG: hypothetical protein A2Y03_02340 [Omnitrophica WOR_2 bacterium GWF2_38_59]OGX47812.1 MAG: hypothetical protein A2243_00755 [Omnitrophica WOR_2 bacterium RIFOXYA2_FULL_38_17]OGX52904.1 MAG: hypothetical protein A2267_04185 [Omnitrophica WOR_2 bacterium RIFOXYA12_FULL_38_10]OGX56063.1 MAG: hypothetical protein A2306_00410 [Omnitrophica WOR_2 bacterium RIFOXYB2_FULL_38_16]OGX56967.1 MAG: hypothetical protein A2447_05650 [Omnitrophica WOR_2 bacterium RIFOXYC2_FULL_38_12]HBG60301.1 DUF58 do
MLPKELLKKIKQIEITTSRLVSDVFAGQYHSVFKGQGIEFDEVREYQIGDDIRTIDWNVTARTGIPHIKKFVEERELVVMIMVDVSRSSKFATEGILKNQLAAEISSLLALSAIRNNDKVGLIVFTDKIEKFIPPRKGTKHVLRVIREVLYFKPDNNKTNINNALDYLNKVTTRRTISFLISDYLTDEGHDGLKKSLSAANKRHDLIAITLNDPREQNLPDCGLITLEDAETGQIVVIDSTDKKVREKYLKLNQARIIKRKELFCMSGVDFIDISTDMSYSDEIVKFFLKRRKRIRR